MSPNPFDQILQKLEKIDRRLISIEVINGGSSIPWDLVGVDKVCEITGFKKPTIYAKVSANKIPFKKKGNRLFFSVKELEQWIRQEEV